MKKILLILSLLWVFLPSLLLADEESTQTPVPDPIAITLRIETASATLFNGTLTVSACPTFPESTTQTVSGFCALEQSGLTNVWTWYGEDAFLDSTNGIANDSSSSSYWTWFSNLELGPVALNKHRLTAHETLLLAIGTVPLKINVSNTAPEVNTPTTITISKFSFDSSFNPVWLPASSSTIHIGSYTLTADTEGTATFTATTTDPLEIYATETNFLSTEHVTITPTPNTVATPAPSEPSSGSGGGSILPSKGDPNAALAFLMKHQQSDGAFGGVLQNDWVALALVGNDKSQASLNALTPHLLQQDELTDVTDYERRAMALEALGIDPYSHSHTIKKIISEFDGVQIGNPNLVNDDIFSLFPLTHAGYTKADDVIAKEIPFILSNQNQNGSWESVDLTSAAIQALVPFSDLEGVPDAIRRAREYLVSQQDSNGCFGNSYSTSWAIQAIVALGESPLTWTVWGGSTPLSCMGLLQAPDGGFGLIEATTESRIWATAYAIPALQGKSWNTILQEFPKQTIPIENSNTASEEIATTTGSSLHAPISGVVLGTSTIKRTPTISTTNRNGTEEEEIPARPLFQTEQLIPTIAPPTLLSTVTGYLLLLMQKATSLLHL